MIEHLLHAFVQVLDVLVRLVRKSIAGGSSPNQLLAVCVEKINHQRPDLVSILSCCGGSEAAEPASPAPAPTAAEIVVERVESLVILTHLQRDNGNVATRFHRRQAFRRQGGIDG